MSKIKQKKGISGFGKSKEKRKLFEESNSINNQMPGKNNPGPADYNPKIGVSRHNSKGSNGTFNFNSKVPRDFSNFTSISEED
jgi:hypothetical protein